MKFLKLSRDTSEQTRLRIKWKKFKLTGYTEVEAKADVLDESVELVKGIYFCFTEELKVSDALLLLRGNCRSVLSWGGGRIA